VDLAACRLGMPAKYNAIVEAINEAAAGGPVSSCHSMTAKEGAPTAGSIWGLPRKD